MSTDKKPRQLEVNGVKFSEIEIVSVTIKRAGTTIYLEQPDEKRVVGFGKQAK